MEQFTVFTTLLMLLLLADDTAGIRDTQSHHQLWQPTDTISRASHWLEGLLRLRQAVPPTKQLQPIAGKLQPLAKEKAAFLAEHGDDYGYQGWIDAHWHDEVGVRLPGGQHYLDYTGSALYANTQVKHASQMLLTEAFGNPHSRNPSSYRSAKDEDWARKRVLKWLGADEKDYVLVWTRSATEALKMIGEWFPWSAEADFHPQRDVPPGGVSYHAVGHVSKCGGPLHFKDDKNTGKASHFVYTRANHKSVLGAGAYGQDKGALLSCADENDITVWLDDTTKAPATPSPSSAVDGGGSTIDQEEVEGLQEGSKSVAPTYSLLAYPAKDNYEGVLYPLDWVKKAHFKSTADHKWLVLLDAAAYVPIHPLNLTETPADFITLSLYKVFGYPTGLGVLVIRKEAAEVLHKVYFGGGAVDDATAEDIWRLLSPAPARFQDGTIDFLGVAQLQFGFELLDELNGTQAVHRHVSALQSWTYQHLSSLKHSNNRSLLTIFGKHDKPQEQSCLFQFLVHQPNGSVWAAQDVEITAAAAGLHLRTGCHCNPGACLKDLGIHPEEERAAAIAHNTSHGFITVMRTTTTPDGKPEVKPVQLPIGSVRASLGALSTFGDVYALVEFLQEEYVDNDGESGLESESRRLIRERVEDMQVSDYWNGKCGA